MNTDLFPAEFSKFAGILSAALSQHHLSGFEIAQIPSPPLALFIMMLPKAHLTSHSKMSDSLQPRHALLCMEFSRQEYWNGLSFPSPGDLPYLGIEPGSSALRADSFTSEPPEIYSKIYINYPSIAIM